MTQIYAEVTIQQLKQVHSATHPARLEKVISGVIAQPSRWSPSANSTKARKDPRIPPTTGSASTTSCKSPRCFIPDSATAETYASILSEMLRALD